VEYADVSVIELTEQGVYALLEAFLPGEFQKFNDNMGRVMGGSLAQAFSHFTWEASKHTELMCDVQGIVDGKFTDAMLHTVCGQAYGGGAHGNRGKRGIADFLDTHRCEGTCKALGLPYVEGCYAQKAHRAARRKRCGKCGREKDWDAEHQACWTCDEEFLTQMHLDTLLE